MTLSGTGRIALVATGIALTVPVTLLLVGGRTGDAPQASASDPAPTPGDRATAAAPSPRSGPASPGQRVRRAYLHGWDVYARAVRTGRAAGLRRVFAGDALRAVRAELSALRRRGLVVRVRVRHRIEVLPGAVAAVVDRYVNRSVALDAHTGSPVTDSYPELVTEAYTMKEVGERWKVTAIARRSVRRLRRSP